MMSETESEQFSLRWNNFHSNLTSGFHALLQGEDLVDVTLAAGGQFVQAHKIVLSVCSPYFKDLFKVNPCKHPIVILKDVCHKELVAILQFMYRGEVNVRQEELATFLKTAEMLQIKGLTGDDSLSEEESVPFPPTPVRTKAPRRTAEKTPQSVRATPEKKQPVAPVPEIITAEPEESSTPQYKRMRSETSAPVLNSPVVSEETSTVELMEISNPKQEPVEYESEIEEVERLQNRDESLVQLLGGESSQTLQDSSQGSSIFASIPSASQDSGLPQDSGQGNRTWTQPLRFACPECNREFVNRNNLSVHMRDAHGEGRGPFSCPYCNKLSKNRSSLRNHLYYSHNIRAKRSAEQSKSSNAVSRAVFKNHK
ncbi:modifier of mdg4-like isoform X4 [Periplaneta americana]|uniref:modifier of mdg4-like isoform X4 n=1 Tax=Periplaneta americana TaxID=6978 RepID=UPI0037E9A736